MVRTFAAAAALIFAGSALALPQGAFWTEVAIVDDPGDATNMAGLRTFDLWVTMEAGDVLNAADFGIAGPNIGLSTTQTVFNHPFGNDLEPTAFFLGAFPDLEWDTYLAMGDLNGDLGEITVQSANWAVITAVWNPNAPGGFSTASPNSGLDLILARITVSSAGGFGDFTGLFEFLGGELFVSGSGPNGLFGQQIADLQLGVVTVPNAFPIPTPGAVALFGLAGCVVTRRRR